MEIVNTKISRVRADREEHTNWIFVELETDTGVVGVGEASLQYKDAAVMADLRKFGEFLQGRDPRRIEHLWTSMYRRVTWTGGPVTMSAISAIDLALWDIKGKVLGRPVYALLGGPTREAVPTYANGWFEGAESTGALAGAARDVADEGYRGVKFYPFLGEQVIDPDRLQKGVDAVGAVRDAVGSGCEIAVDIRGRLNRWSAERVAKGLTAYDIAWLEEPVLFDNVDALVTLARQIDVPVATGEQLFSRWDFEPLLNAQAVGIIQPDICHAGGISELTKIAAAAQTHYTSVAPHNSNGPISTVASLHLDMAIPNCFMQEVFVNYLDRYDELLTSSIQLEDGLARPPAGPGWGTELEADAIARAEPVDQIPIESEPYQDF